MLDKWLPAVQLNSPCPMHCARGPLSPAKAALGGRRSRPVGTAGASPHTPAGLTLWGALLLLWTLLLLLLVLVLARLCCGGPNPYALYPHLLPMPATPPDASRLASGPAKPGRAGSGAA
jgi:hypothetical protein